MYEYINYRGDVQISKVHKVYGIWIVEHFYHFKPGSVSNCLVAVVGFNQTAYTFGEGDGIVEVCAAFLEPIDPSRIAPNVVVELLGHTSPGTANGK